MNSQFYHALKIDVNKCYGCTHCMMSCPTGAIRIREGLASIRKDWCVDCGECMKACPVGAIYVEQDDFEKIFDFKYRIAILPSVFIGQFSKVYSVAQITNGLYKIGFHEVVPSELSISYLKETFLEYQDKPDAEKPLISPFCPAIVRLIQVKFPSLVENIIALKPPIDASAVLIRKITEDHGIAPKDIGIFYVTPCAAKIATVKSPVGESQSYVDGVINMDFLYNKVLQELHAHQEEPLHEAPIFTPNGLKWSLTNGEATHMKGRCLAIDEIHNVMKFLERLENGEIINVDFLELRACDHGCAGGVLMSENRFLTVERMNRHADKMADQPNEIPDHDYYEPFIKEKLKVGTIEPRSMVKLHEDMETALKRMQRVRQLMCYLPGIDCGACGSPNCLSLAEDVVRNEAFLSNCVFIQRMMEKNRKLSNEHAFRIIEKTWGKDRLDKDCYKKGAKNEGI
ncbi:MAG: [Fe-Fe] hydrogenase large subunit C-terminal domain-containing protein [Breznakibacter sp.]